MNQKFHNCKLFCRWRMSGMRSYNPEQIMLSAVVRRPSRDVNIMKEKLIFSGKRNKHTQVVFFMCSSQRFKGIEYGDQFAVKSHSRFKQSEKQSICVLFLPEVELLLQQQRRTLGLENHSQPHEIKCILYVRWFFKVSTRKDSSYIHVA